MNDKEALQKRRLELVTNYNKIIQEKGQIKHRIRTGGHMPAGEYRQLCDRQLELNREVAEVVQQLSEVKLKLAMASDENHEQETSWKKGLVEQLVALRDEYEAFAADPTRVSSTRLMAAEFTKKLTRIIRRV